MDQQPPQSSLPPLMFMLRFVFLFTAVLAGVNNATPYEEKVGPGGYARILQLRNGFARCEQIASC